MITDKGQCSSHSFSPENYLSVLFKGIRSANKIQMFGGAPGKTFFNKKMPIILGQERGV